MITLRKAADRFHTKIAWLDSWHSFSFGEHYDPRHMGFGPLRVINDDRVAAGGGFPTHPHRDMEIITVVLSGALEHKDSIGTGSVIKPGDVQKMSAGSGIRHSEFNGSQKGPVHLLQIWIEPNQEGVKPEYQQIHFPEARMQNQFCLVCSPDGAENSISLYQDARLYLVKLTKGNVVNYDVQPGRKNWVQMATGQADILGTAAQEGDGLAIEDEKKLTFTAKSDSMILLFDLAA